MSQQQATALMCYTNIPANKQYIWMKLYLTQNISYSVHEVHH